MKHVNLQVVLSRNTNKLMGKCSIFAQNIVGIIKAKVRPKMTLFSLRLKQHLHHIVQAMLPLKELGICNLPGCTKYNYQDPANGRVHPFCSRTHASQAIQIGMYSKL